MWPLTGCVPPGHRPQPTLRMGAKCRCTGSLAHLALVLLLTLLVGGCERGGAPGVLETPHQPLDGLLPAELVIGLGDATDSIFFARISDAAFVGREHIAVLDEVPPYLRVFDKNGRLVGNYLEKGGGPGEARRPYALAANDEGEMIVLHEGGATLLSVDRGFLGRVTLTEFIPQDVGFGCGGWVFYGAGRWRGASGERAWARVVSIDSTEVTTIEESLYDTSTPPIYSHKPGQAADAWVIHGRPESLQLHRACDDAQTQPIPDRIMEDIHAMLWRPSMPEQEMVIRAGDAVTTGFARLDTGVLMSLGIFNPGGTFDSFLVHFTPEGPRVGSSGRSLRLSDVGAGGELLLTFNAPVPHLRVVPHTALGLF